MDIEVRMIETANRGIHFPDCPSLNTATYDLKEGWYKIDISRRPYCSLGGELCRHCGNRWNDAIVQSLRNKA